MTPAVVEKKSKSESKRTPQMLAAICKLVQKGLTVRHAGEKLHVHHTTVGRWRHEVPEFDAAILAAEAEFINSQIANIRTAAKTSWQASAWLLERKFPVFFSQPQVQLNMPNARIQFEDFGAMLKRYCESPEAARLPAVAAIEVKEIELTSAQTEEPTLNGQA